MDGQPQPAVLPYADVPTPDGADGVTTVTVRADCRRVIIRPVRRSRGGGGLVWGTVVLVAYTAVFAVQAAAAPPVDRGMWAGVVEVGAISAILACLAFDRRHRRLAYEVTPQALRQTIAGPFGLNHAAWPRSAVRDVHLNRFTNKLVLRLGGQDLLEVYLGPDPASNQRAADAIAAALLAVPPAPAAEQVALPSTAPGLPPSRARTVLLTIAGIVTVLGFASSFVVPVAGCYVLPLAAIPAGLALGSRPRDFYT